jgi:BirA family biotin operon repressor/biotin-[acetyl-CoA-carboxylase] ligase
MQEMGRLRVWYPSVGSTMDVAASLAACGAPHGTVVQAGYQTAGRGRMGRVWETEPDGALLTSWIMRGPAPSSTPAVLSPLFALALIRAVEQIAPSAPVGYKWPNDVLAGDRKLAGILLTSRLSGDRLTIVAGIGVNVGRNARFDDRALLSEWCSSISVEQVRDALAERLDEAWQAFREQPVLREEDRHELEAHMCWADEPVRVLVGDGEVTGCIAGLEPDGALRIWQDAAGEVVLRIGEVVRGPRRIAEKPVDRYRILS